MAMGEESRLEALLSLWEGQLAQGRDVPAADLCRDQPELLNELERRIGRLRQLGQLVQGINGSPSLTTQPPQPDVGSDVGQTMDTDAGTTLALPAHAAPPGYEILGELGRGGMGVVYKARQIALDRTVALKMILHADHAAAEARARFRTEARAVARLQHPHIVQVFEVGEHQGQPYFSLEFCAGGSLSRSRFASWSR
jgi:serine/threonine protein kinase